MSNFVLFALTVTNQVPRAGSFIQRKARRREGGDVDALVLLRLPLPPLLMLI